MEIMADNPAGPVLDSILKGCLLGYTRLLKIQRTLTLTEHFSIIWLGFLGQLA